MGDLAGILTAVSLIIVAITGLYTAQSARKAALRAAEIVRQVTPPSEPDGGRTLGQIAEGTMVNAHAAALDAGRTRNATLDSATGLAAIHGAVVTTAEAVVTSNGKTLGALADLAEGRRVIADVPEADRSQAETHYADRADADAAKQASENQDENPSAQ